MGLTLKTPPTDYPVTLAEAKLNSRVRHNDEDDLFEGLIAAATDYVEQYTWSCLMDQTWLLTLDAFTDQIEILRGPVIEVPAVRYYDADGTLQTLPTDAYTVDLASYRGWVIRNSATPWPTTLAGVNAIEIEYLAGYDVVPASLRQAILLLVSHWHKNREAVNIGNIVSDIPFAVEALCAPYRRGIFI